MLERGGFNVCDVAAVTCADCFVFLCPEQLLSSLNEIKAV